MKLRLIQPGHPPAPKILDQCYSKRYFPAEKKPYLVDHNHSMGPYLGIQGGYHILDASSQIASIGPGFNSGPLWGVLHHPNSWTLHNPLGECHPVRMALHQHLQNMLGWPHANTTFCNSGSEANEVALGECWARRRYPSQKKVLAFKGSFHGRTMAALSATWNPAKREPFEWPGYESIFVDHPTLPGDKTVVQEFSMDWVRCWADPFHASFQKRYKKLWEKGDPLLKTEATILKAIHECLRQQIVFAVIIEPMQCEGGYRHSSARFHHALANMCISAQVPLVYDEVQTGFGAGNTFFWHTQFELRDDMGKPIFPDYVVCAKKSQSAIVISPHAMQRVESYSMASLIRGYYQAMHMDQYQQEHNQLGLEASIMLRKLVDEFHQVITNPKSSGLLLSFDFKEEKNLTAFINKRFEHGMLFYPAGTHTVRFCLNTSFTLPDMHFLFGQIRLLLQELCALGKPQHNSNHMIHGFLEPAQLLDMHLQLVEICKKNSGIPSKKCWPDFKKLMNNLLANSPSQSKDLRWEKCDAKNFRHHAKAIARIQNETYEPARRSSLQTIVKILAESNSFSLILLKGKSVIGMAISAPLRCFPAERGLKRDSGYDDDKCIYAMDVTIHPSCRGQGLGRVLKFGMAAWAAMSGMYKLNSRNRDKMARQMMTINHSLGAYTQEHIRRDYPDTLPDDDCYLCTIPLTWPANHISLSDGIQQHLTSASIKTPFMKRNGMALVNKICLSNFVTKNYIEDLGKVIEQLPASMRNTYAASGMSECVDKIAKILWHQRKPRKKFLSFAGNHFGEGTFLARDLSGSSDPFFPVEILPFPDGKQTKDILNQIEKSLLRDDILAVWVEPMLSREMKRMPLNFLKSLRKCCLKHSTPLVYHDTAGLFHRYAPGGFSPSNVAGIRPDLAYAYLGGQMALLYMEKCWWIDTPLTLISTWDGDEYSLAAYAYALKHMGDIKSLIQKFEKCLRATLKPYPIRQLELRQGCGWFEGEIPPVLSAMFKCSDDRRRYLVCPSVQQMKNFVQNHG